MHHFSQGGPPSPSSSAGLATGSPRTGRAAKTAGGHVSRLSYPVRSRLPDWAAGGCGAGAHQAADHSAGRRRKCSITNCCATFSHSLLTKLPLCLQSQTGVQDYEIFNSQLDSLGRWIIEAEGALKIQDPNGSTDLTVVQDRMEELKVCFDLLLS